MVSHEIDLETNELCLIDSGIRNLRDVPLRPHLQILNLHSNCILQIENLGHLRFLKHLDLSSNQITRIEGLDGLASLRTLNLSCNAISMVDGLSSLRSLVKLNLSYNQINDLSGFTLLTGNDFKLTHIELQGNQLSSSAHINKSLFVCANLKQLVLSQDGSSNPVCHQPGYPLDILKALPQIQVIDGLDRAGRPVVSTDILADIPGLEDYIDFLMSNGSGSNEPSSLELTTPKIDQAMEIFRQRYNPKSDVSTSASGTDIEASSEARPVKQEKRLEFLENQLAQLMLNQRSEVVSGSASSDEIVARDKQIRENLSSKLVARRDVDLTDESDSGDKKGVSRKPRKSRIPGYRKSTSSSRARSEERKSTTETSSGSATADGGQEESSNRLSKQPTSPRVCHERDRPTAKAVDDKQLRNDAQSTYVQLMQELEQERERRWKAEQAAKKLADHIKELHLKAKGENELRDTAIEATTRLKQALTNEREVKIRVQDELGNVKEQLKIVTNQLGSAREAEESQKYSMKTMEETIVKTERERLQQQAHEQKKYQEAQMRAAALNRELDLVKSTVTTQKGQLGQLQELLAAREQQHREEMKKYYSLGSKELQEVIQQEVSRVEKKHVQDTSQQHEKVELLTKQYSDLENEFRMALQIEASRFQELQEAFQNVSEENAQNKQALLAAQKKDEKSSAMLNELTALVKEQKGRIAELSTSKKEQSVEYRERIQTLEAHVEEARKRMVQLELLKKDKTKLLATTQAQESIIEGLRAERDLWGQELAQQGASLAQDRGRLDSKIETQKAELAMIKKQLDRETDAVKIKTKMLEDQTETVKKLKEGLLERDEEIKRVREEALKIQKNVEEQLTEERVANQDCQEALERLRERKADLKQQASDLQTELEESKKAHNILKNRWKEKSELIGQLEQQVQQMRDTWEGKEKKLTEERDKAVEAASLALEKMRTADDAFRNQLDSKEQSHQTEILRLEQEKQLELDAANMRIFGVEEEMRELLQETQASKKGMEDKMKRLNQAMNELHSDFM